MTDIKERTLSMTCTSQIDGVMVPDSHPHSVGNLTQSSEKQNPWVTVTIPLTRSGHFSTLSPLFTLFSACRDRPLSSEIPVSCWFSEQSFP